MKIKYSECSCEECSSMCHAPCCGNPNDMARLIEAGYGKRLMLDDWPGGETLLKPALKGHEGCYAPWKVRTASGCTFWREGKCELHSLGLKPEQGKLVTHGTSKDEHEEIGDYIKDSWKDGKGDEVIKKWKEINDEES